MGFLKSAKGKVILIISVLLIIAAVILCILFLPGKADAYRSISVSELSGEVKVENNGKVYDAYPDMNLSDGYALSTGIESFTRMILDSDKYVKLEEKSRAVFEKLGKKGDGHTTINLEKGAITNEITRPLSEDETYIVNTPNAVLAVRGTFFRIEVITDEKGDCYTDVLTYGGAVECKRVFPDGTIAEEAVIIDAGYKTKVKMDTSDTIYVIEEVQEDGEVVNTAPIVLSEDIPDDDIVDILDAAQNGHEMYITIEEIVEAAEEREIKIEEHTSRYDGSQMTFDKRPAAEGSVDGAVTSAPVDTSVIPSMSVPNISTGPTTLPPSSDEAASESAPEDTAPENTEAPLSDTASETAAPEDEALSEEITEEATEETSEETAEETSETEVSEDETSDEEVSEDEEETDEDEESSEDEEETDEDEESSEDEEETDEEIENTEEEESEETAASEETEEEPAETTAEEETPVVTTTTPYIPSYTTGSSVTAPEIHVCVFENYVYNNDATCTEDGTKTAECSCGETDTITAEGTATGHTFGTYISNGDATCTEDGTKTAECHCGKTDTITDIDSATGHTFGTYVSDDNATCTEDGTKTAECHCGKTDTITDINSAKGHTTETETIAPTFYTEGSLHEYCTVEGCDYDETTVLEVLPPLDLSDGDVTITATGYSQGGAEEIPFTDDYLFSGTSTGSVLTVQSGTHNIEFDSTSISVTDKAAFTVGSGASVVLSGTLDAATETTDALGESDILTAVPFINNGTAEFKSGTFTFTGSMYSCVNNGNADITGAEVSSEGMIGFQNSSGALLTVSGGKLITEGTAVDGIYNNGNISIERGSCTFTGANAGINNQSGSVEISGGTVTCSGNNGIYQGDAEFTITNGSVTTSSFYAYSDAAVTGGSLKVEDIYLGGSGSIVDEIGNKLYRLVIANPSNATVAIDGTTHNTSYHSNSDSNLYAYVTGEYHNVTVGSTTTAYNFNTSTNEFEISDLQITGTSLQYGTDFTYPADTGVLSVLSSKAVRISGSTTTDTVFVPDGVNADITLAGVSIDVSGTANACAFEIENCSTGNTTLTLATGTTNTLKSGSSRAGLQKTGGGEAIIGELTITGSGTLNATGGDYGAGIGGNETNFSTTGWSDGSDITIAGGTVIATGGYGGAGIGGGYGGQGRFLTITGGTVIATGDGAAGIGGGQNHLGNDIVITGGIITATSNYGYAIGGAPSTYGFDGLNYVIDGGTLKLTSGESSPIGNMSGEAVTPVNSDGESVYLLTISNPGSAAVTIDGTAYTYSVHGNGDTNLYVYLTGTDHTISVGGVSTAYSFNGTDGFTASA